MVLFKKSCFIIAFLSFAVGSLHAAPASSEGRLLYDRHCSVCHSMAPPPKSAPPIIGISLHYREAFSDRGKGVKHMAEFMKKPDAKNSKLEAAATTRFGLMPAMSLSDKELAIVAGWVWDSHDPNFRLPGNCK
ncbi:MAG: cytochrome c [Chlorobiaceae bacterium]|nr:cytochrome c [Chlorobiaceae bacterium]NTV60283.1 cytochrome c [Chlorobiaceae bacterium]